MSEAYELITRSLEELQSSKQAEYRTLQTVLGHISIGVACYQKDGKIIFSNKSFDQLLNLPGIIYTDRIKKDFPIIYKIMTQENLNQTEWIDHLDGQKLFVKTESIKLREEEYKLLSLTDIRSSLDTKELESYQRLMRVMTHEIMNSANPILSLIRVVNKKLISGKELKTLEKIDQKNIAISLNAIEERTDGILKFVRGYKEINQSIQPQIESINSNEVCATIEAWMNEASDTKFSVQDNLKAPIKIDLALMNQVLINLIKNADDAVAEVEDREISMKLEQREQWVYIQVEDNGPGVSADDVNQIFTPFYTTKKEGSGIGLALSRKIIKAHGGWMEYSRKHGKTQFTIRLPI